MGEPQKTYEELFDEAYLGSSPLDQNLDQEQMARRGSPAQHKEGVCFRGPWTQENDGFNGHVRRAALALSMSGLPVHLQESRPRLVAEPPAVVAPLSPFDPRIEAISDCTFAMQMCIVHQAVLTDPFASNLISHASYDFVAMAKLNKFRIISSVFERDSVSPAILKALREVGRVWVACSTDKKMLERNGVSPSQVEVHPIPFFDDDPLLAIQKQTRRPGPIRFYHIGKWEPRKAQHLIMEAFLRTFKPGEATFVMKTSPGQLRKVVDDFPSSPRDCLRDLLGRVEVQKNGWTPDTLKAGFELVDAYVDPSVITKLHAFGDVYVSYSRGEGFDMPAFDARLAGRPVLHTATGAPLDFHLPQADMCVEDLGLRPCHDIYNWPGSQYLELGLEPLQEAMFAMALTYERRREAIAGGWSRNFMDGFSASRVGAAMRRSVEDVVAKARE